MTAGDQRRVGDRCPGTLDAAGLHAATCLVGGRRKHTHNGQRDLWAQQLPGAGYAVQREQHVPAWDRWVQRRNGRWEQEHAILDLRLEAPPDAPVTYLDVVVAHPCSGTYVEGPRQRTATPRGRPRSGSTRATRPTPGSAAGWCLWRSRPTVG